MSENLEQRGQDQPRRRARRHYEGDPTLFKVMRKPKWIGALLFALVIAGVFAWLGQWQLENAIRIDHEQSIDSEAVRPIGEVVEPGGVVTDGAAGMVVSVSGAFAPGDFSVIEQRANGGETGAWVTGHLVVPGADAAAGADAAVSSSSGSGGGHLAVAIGWAPDAASAERALSQFEADYAGREVSLEGRFMPSDGPVRPAAGDDQSRILSMAPAQLVNLWQPFEGRAFAGYLVVHLGEGAIDERALTAHGLDAIDSVPPLPAETINWVSLFYALEWVVFAGFAVFFWYRLVRDDWEKTHELQLLRAAEAANAA